MPLAVITQGHRVRRVDAVTRAISTFAGVGVALSAGDGGLAVNAQLNTPAGIAIDSADDSVFVAEFFGHRVRRIDASGAVPKVLGGSEQRARRAQPCARAELFSSLLWFLGGPTRSLECV